MKPFIVGNNISSSKLTLWAEIKKQLNRWFCLIFGPLTATQSGIAAQLHWLKRIFMANALAAQLNYEMYVLQIH